MAPCNKCPLNHNCPFLKYKESVRKDLCSFPPGWENNMLDTFNPNDIVIQDPDTWHYVAVNPFPQKRKPVIDAGLLLPITRNRFN